MTGYTFEHFLGAQAHAYAQARAELAAGQKRTHWMWFIFPQLKGLGSSAMAQRFALSGTDEAAAYLRHPVLGTRLRACTALVTAVQDRTLQQIFGSPDDLKFHSSVTLFALADPEEPVFQAALRRYFDGATDARTLALLGRGSRATLEER